ncbi:MAG: hypothetical protein R3B09_06645 [Nannocystaceae bacterium]
MRRLDLGVGDRRPIDEELRRTADEDLSERLFYGAPEVRRLDPPGLVDGGAVLAARGDLWQYSSVNVVVVVREDRASCLVPAVNLERRPRVLPPIYGRPWVSYSPVWTVARLLADRRAAAEHRLGRVDLGRLLHPGLLRLVRGRDERVLDDVIEVLDVLACVRDYGRHSNDRPRVRRGRSALDCLHDYVRWCESERDHDETRWIDPALRLDLEDPLRRALFGEDDEAAAREGRFQSTALVRQHQSRDGSTGFHDEATLVTLRVNERGWSYVRRPLVRVDVIGSYLS